VRGRACEHSFHTHFIIISRSQVNSPLARSRPTNAKQETIRRAKGEREQNNKYIGGGGRGNAYNVNQGVTVGAALRGKVDVARVDIEAGAGRPRVGVIDGARSSANSSQ
jgi:hypothetical protein